MTQLSEQRVYVPSRLHDALTAAMILILVFDLVCAVGTAGTVFLSWGYHPAITIASTLLWTQIVATGLLIVVGYPGSVIAIDFIASSTDDETTLTASIRAVIRACRDGGFDPVLAAAVVLSCFRSVLGISSPILMATVSVAYLVFGTWLTRRCIRQFKDRAASPERLYVVESCPVAPVDSESPLVKDYERCYGPEWPLAGPTRQRLVEVMFGAAVRRA